MEGKMRLSFGLEARQQQVQKLAPRMIQSMEILQLPIQALQERVEQEIIENPILELAEGDEQLPDALAEPEPQTAADGDQELVVRDDQSNVDDFERLANMDSEMPDQFDDFRPSASRIQQISDQQHDLMANAVNRQESLNDHLLHQLSEMELDSEIESFAERIISTLSAADGGYFRGTLEDLIPRDSAIPLKVAEEALRVVQSLDPRGIAARDLKECLLLQIPEDHDLAIPMRRLIADHLEDLAENRLPAIQKRTGYSLETIQQVRSAIHVLNPKPGAEFLEDFAPTVTPDVYVDLDEHGNYVARLEEMGTPPLRISNYYRSRLKDPTSTPEELEYIKRKIHGAQWLIDAIQQRRNTILRVTQAIVDHQRRFLEEGPEAIEPLKMQQIADAVHVHVTTVSRAVDDKWVQTPRGIYPLKRFFVGGTRTDDGEDVAWDAIRIKLQEIIDKEDKKNPLSDDEIMASLQRDGLNVARRTITKYRKKMGIPSSRQRRDWTKRTGTKDPD